MMRAIGLYLAFIAWALWMGGFAFYFGVVVPTGGKVIGGSEQGFVTQQVTHWLNLIGVAALVILLGNAIQGRDRILLGTWALLVACHIALFAMHWQLDNLIDAPEQSVVDATRFRKWHEWYETVATVQWLTGMVHLGGIVRVFGIRTNSKSIT